MVAAERKKYIYILINHYLKHTRSTLSPTLCVDWFGGGAFLLKRASEMASYGSVSSFKMVKRGLSHRFLESGASNLNTKASKLQNKTTWQKLKKKKKQESDRNRKRTVLEPRPCAHMSWLYRSAASLLMFHDELTSSDVKQYTCNQSTIRTGFWLTQAWIF